ncbi:MAG: ribonuclease G [Nevskiales bacterium]
MSGEILVNVAPRETRVALLEGGQLQEIFVQRADRHGLVGNVYLGRVKRVLPGMQAAFVDIGLERTAFLHVSDLAQAEWNNDEEIPDIRRYLHEGDELLVQILKDPLGSKGARLTTQISIPSRYLVLLPDSGSAGVSVKIEDETERERLKQVVTRLMAEQGVSGGYIVRTAGEGAGEEALATDMQFLARLWQSVQGQAKSVTAGALVHGDLPLVMRILRDLLGTEVERVRIDSREGWQQLVEFARNFVPEMESRIELHETDGPIFDLYGVEDELARALDRKVPLKSGGYLVIDQTEAMTTVDINTGGYVGHRNLEETILKTNLEAAQAIARQLRLRNLGGIIIVDFIDMQNAGHREGVQRALEKALQRDPAKTVISEMSVLGLVQMTRKRTRESLGHILCEPCPACGGRGSIKTVETVCNEIFREIMRSARQFDAKALVVLASPEVVTRLLDEQSGVIAELEELIHKPIRLQAETLYPQESFDVVLV